MPAHVAHPLLTPRFNSQRHARRRSCTITQCISALAPTKHIRSYPLNLPLRWGSLPSYKMASTRKRRARRPRSWCRPRKEGSRHLETVHCALTRPRSQGGPSSHDENAPIATLGSRGIFCSPVDASAPACGWSTNSDRAGAKLWVAVGKVGTSMRPKISGDGGGMQARRTDNLGEHPLARIKRND